MRRVAITGLGVISPLGNDTSDFFNNLMSGRSGVRRITAPFSQRLSSKIAAEADFDPHGLFHKKQLSYLDRTSQMALAAANQAWEDSAITLDEKEKPRAGTSIGTAMGGAATLEETYSDLYRGNVDRVKPFTVLAAMSNAPASHVSIAFGLKGPCLTYTTACSSSAVAAGEAFRQIRDGYADVMVAGGAEALLTLGVIKSWESLGILAVENAVDPAASCRPFAMDRTGFVLGEGAAMFVLEELSRAEARGAGIYGELIGYGSTADGFHITKPSVDGQADAINAALSDASIRPEDVDYINAHGTATRLNDVVETLAIKRAFGVHAHRVPVSSTKSMHGHMMGAAGAVELLASTLAVVNRAVPPTANLFNPDPECDLDYVPLEGRRGVEVRTAMSNSFAFGGTNAVLIVRGYEQDISKRRV